MEWKTKIQKRSDECFLCNSQFDDAQRYHCILLYESPEGGFLRSDYCDRCWCEHTPSDTVTSAFSYWQGLYKAPVREKGEGDILPRDRLERFLRQLLGVEQGDEQQRKFCYVLALLLERKRILVQRDEKYDAENQKKWLIYEHADTGDTYMIEIPPIKHSDIPHIQAQIKEMLDTAEHF